MLDNEKPGRRRLWLIAVGSLFVLLACGIRIVTEPPVTEAGPVSVVLFGDSLAYQAAPYFDTLIQDGGRAHVKNYVFGGTAVCDWLPDMHDVARSHPQVAVMEFVGNAFTQCMNGCPAGSASAVNLYCADMTEAVHLFLAAGTHVFLEGTPIDYTEWISHDRHWNDLNREFSALASRFPGQVTYVDAGTSVEGPGGTFTWTLPCLTFEPCDGPTIAGVHTDVVRSPDGVHFCPVGGASADGQVTPCDVYSSGAFRFAAAMASPVIKEFHLSPPPVGQRSFVARLVLNERVCQQIDAVEVLGDSLRKVVADGKCIR